MGGIFLTLIVSFFMALAVASILGWLMPHAEMEEDVTQKSYRFGLLVGSLYIFAGFFWAEWLLLDLTLGLIGHGFSSDILFSIMICSILLLVGVGVSWRWKYVLYAAPFVSLCIPYLFINGLDTGGLPSASSGEIVALVLILLMNVYYFYYNYRLKRP